MSGRIWWRNAAQFLLCACGCVCVVACAMPRLAGAAELSTPDLLLERLQGAPLHPFSHKPCLKRVGPLASQSVAWQRWRDSQNQGRAVSQGVFPCHVHRGTRGYCFNVYTRC